MSQFLADWSSNNIFILIKFRITGFVRICFYSLIGCQSHFSFIVILMFLSTQSIQIIIWEIQLVLGAVFWNTFNIRKHNMANCRLQCNDLNSSLAVTQPRTHRARRCLTPWCGHRISSGRHHGPTSQYTSIAPYKTFLIHISDSFPYKFFNHSSNPRVLMVKWKCC